MLKPEFFCYQLYYVPGTRQRQALDPVPEEPPSAEQERNRAHFRSRNLINDNILNSDLNRPNLTMAHADVNQSDAQQGSITNQNKGATETNNQKKQ